MRARGGSIGLVRDADAVITSERLALPLLSLDQLDRLFAGEVPSVATELGATFSDEWLEMARWLAGMRARQIRERPVDAPWLLRPRHGLAWPTDRSGSESESIQAHRT